MNTIVLTESDKEELLQFLEKISSNITHEDLGVIERKLSKKINCIRKNKLLPKYVDEMIRQIKKMMPLLSSKNIETDALNRIIAAFDYFLKPEDKIPDYIPVIGYIDDAFVISTVFNSVKECVTQLKSRS